MALVRLTSRIPQIQATLPALADATLRSGAEGVVAGARERVHVDSGDLQGAIHVERDGPGEYRVVAGSDDVFYGHMEEFGTSHSAAHPFLLPALEAEAQSIETALAVTLSHL